MRLRHLLLLAVATPLFAQQQEPWRIVRPPQSSLVLARDGSLIGEIGRFVKRELADYPPFPENYFTLKSQGILEEHRERLRAAQSARAPIPDLPESLLAGQLDNTWHDTAEAVINNWVGKVYQITNNDRRLAFMEGVDPRDPLGLGKK